jgi:NADH-quinone oxidoreductase subunit M
MHLVGSWYRGSFAWLERALVSCVDFMAYGANGLYRFVQPMLFVLVAAVAVAAWAV